MANIYFFRHHMHQQATVASNQQAGLPLHSGPNLMAPVTSGITPYSNLFSGTVKDWTSQIVAGLYQNYQGQVLDAGNKPVSGLMDVSGILTNAADNKPISSLTAQQNGNILDEMGVPVQGLMVGSVIPPKLGDGPIMSPKHPFEFTEVQNRSDQTPIYGWVINSSSGQLSNTISVNSGPNLMAPVTSGITPYSNLFSGTVKDWTHQIVEGLYQNNQGQVLDAGNQPIIGLMNVNGALTNATDNIPISSLTAQQSGTYAGKILDEFNVPVQGLMVGSVIPANQGPGPIVSPKDPFEFSEVQNASDQKPIYGWGINTSSGQLYNILASGT